MNLAFRWMTFCACGERLLRDLGGCTGSAYTCLRFPCAYFRGTYDLAVEEFVKVFSSLHTGRKVVMVRWHLLNFSSCLPLFATAAITISSQRLFKWILYFFFSLKVFVTIGFLLLWVSFFSVCALWLAGYSFSLLRTLSERLQWYNVPFDFEPSISL